MMQSRRFVRIAVTAALCSVAGTTAADAKLYIVLGSECPKGTKPASGCSASGLPNPNQPAVCCSDDLRMVPDAANPGVTPRDGTRSVGPSKTVPSKVQ